MGQILSNPVIDKEHHQGRDTFSAFGLCSMQGWRMSMEDAHVVELNIWEENESRDKPGTLEESKDQLAMYGVFDGHGGSGVARYCGEFIGSIFKEQLVEVAKKQKGKSMSSSQLVQCIRDTFLIVDERLLSAKEMMQNDHSGCTSTCVLISKETNTIICANAGDSRTVLATNGIAKALSFDHKPSNMNEKSRIIGADGFVEMDRVNGNLALSRALGDLDFKNNESVAAEEQTVTADPEILKRIIDWTNDDFIILGCDGIWECLSSQECVDLVYHGIMNGNMTLNDITSRIIDVCCAPTTEGSGIGCDNMTIIIVALLNNDETEEQWFNRIRGKVNIKERVTNHSISFEAARKRIYNTFDFDDENVFNVTTKQEQDKLVNENQTKTLSTLREIDENEEDNDKRDIPMNSTVDSSSQEDRTQTSDYNIGAINFESLKQLLEAGIRVRAPHSQQGNSSNESGTISESTIIEMLESLSEAAAGETAPFESDDEEEAREMREEAEKKAKDKQKKED